GIKVMAPVTARSQADAGVLNDIAWVMMAEGSDLAGALALARRADSAQKDDSSIVNTLAVVLVEQGELGEAHTEGWRAMWLGRRPEHTTADNYLIGRIAEQLGLRDDAIAAYKRIGPAPDA